MIQLELPRSEKMMKPLSCSLLYRNRKKRRSFKIMEALGLLRLGLMRIPVNCNLEGCDECSGHRYKRQSDLWS